MIRGASLVFVAALAVNCSAFERRVPNVLLVVMDTTRADRCSFLGYERPTTPRLAELASSSLVFSDAWSPAPWTLPAHVVLFTGCRAERLGLVGSTRRALPNDVPTIASIHGANGWCTAAFSCSTWISPSYGLSRGFATLETLYGKAGPFPAAEAHRRALDWMVAQHAAGRPFFAYVNDMESHSCWNPPEEFARRFLDPCAPPSATQVARTLCSPRTQRIGLGIEKLPEDVIRAASDLYDGEVASLDAELGRLFDAMAVSGLLESTIIVVAGDHGEGLGDHGWLEHCAFLYRELLHVPLLVRLPSGATPRVVSDVVRLEDVLPTILEACGVSAPRAIDGASLLGSTAGRVAVAAERVPEDNCSFMDTVGLRDIAAKFRSGRRSIYDGVHHLIVSGKDDVELFDVRTDPREERNLAGSRSDVTAALRNLLDAAR